MNTQTIKFNVNPEVYIYSDKNDTYKGKYIGKVARLISKNENSCLLSVYGEHILVDVHDIVTMLQKKLIDDTIEHEVISKRISRKDAIESLITSWSDAILLMIHYLGKE